MSLAKDLREFIELLNSLDVHYVVVGGYAVAFHGYPRYTGDIDFFVDSSAENAAKLAQVVNHFGFGELGLTDKDFTVPDQIIQFGLPPNRIDIITSISGVHFEEAWVSRQHGAIGDVSVLFISKELLRRNKEAVGRTQDLADLERF